MISLNEYFDGKIFCINLARREDRWAHAKRQFERYGIAAKRFEAIGGLVDDSGRVNGNMGCTASHRAVLDMQVAAGWPRMLVLEDDFDVIYVDFLERVDRFLSEVPADWGLIYFGGGYAEAPIRRVSKHVIQAGRMMTTSSYGITLAQARKMAPSISGVGPIDSLFQGFNVEAPTYLMSPRAIVQYDNFSDLQEREISNAQSMLSCDLEAGL